MECAADNVCDHAARHDAAYGADRPADQCRISKLGQYARRQHHDPGARNWNETAGNVTSGARAPGAIRRCAAAIGSAARCTAARRKKAGGNQARASTPAGTDTDFPSGAGAGGIGRLIRTKAVANEKPCRFTFSSLPLVAIPSRNSKGGSLNG